MSSQPGEVDVRSAGGARDAPSRRSGATAIARFVQVVAGAALVAAGASLTWRLVGGGVSLSLPGGRLGAALAGGGAVLAGMLLVTGPAGLGRAFGPLACCLAACLSFGDVVGGTAFSGLLCGGVLGPEACLVFWSGLALALAIFAGAGDSGRQSRQGRRGRHEGPGTGECREGSQTCRPRPRMPIVFKAALSILPALAAGALISLSAVQYRSPAVGRPTPSKAPAAGAALAILEPADWAGGQLPILDRIDVSEKLSAGRWNVVMYHHTCPYCRDSLGTFEKDLSGREGIGFALVETPPYARAEDDPVPAGSKALRGKLDESRDWFVTTPVVMSLADGKVLTAREGYSEAELAGLEKGSRKAEPVSSVVVAVEGDRAECDFGFVEPRAIHRVTFEVLNNSESARPMAVARAKSECPCMLLESYPKVIAPGGRGRFVVDLEAPDESTNYSKRVVALTDDPDRHTLALTVKAAVGRPLVVSPGTIDLGRLAAGSRGEAEVTIVNRGKTAIRPVYATSSQRGCIARIPRAAVAPGGRLTIPVVVDASVSPGKVKATISIYTDDPRQASLEVPVSYEVVSGGAREAGRAGQVGEAGTPDGQGGRS